MPGPDIEGSGFNKERLLGKLRTDLNSIPTLKHYKCQHKKLSIYSFLTVFANDLVDVILSAIVVWILATSVEGKIISGRFEKIDKGRVFPLRDFELCFFDRNIMI